MNIAQCDFTHLPQGQDQHLLPLCAVLQADTRARICWQAQHPEATVMNLGGKQDHLLIDAGEPQGLVVVVHRLDVVAGAVRLVPLLLQSLCQHLVFPCCRLFRIELKGIFCLREGGKEGDPLDVLLLGVLIVLPQVWPLLKADLTENLRKLFLRTSRNRYKYARRPFEGRWSSLRPYLVELATAYCLLRERKLLSFANPGAARSPPR